jgi:type IV pilus assembly protein PilO
MTYATEEEFIPVGGQEEEPNYPTAFGMTITPKVGGVIIGVAGLLGAAYLLLNVVQPAWQQNQELQTTVEQKEAEIANQEETLARIEEIKAQLAQARQRNQQVQSLFASEQSLDTLLVDLNEIVQDREATLLKFQLQGEPTIVDDGSLGTQVNGELKRQVIDVEMEGTFEQVQSVLRSIERLQSLLIVRNFQAEVSQPQSLILDEGNVVPGEQPTLKTTFQLEALLPVTEEEKAAAAAEEGQAQ